MSRLFLFNIRCVFRNIFHRIVSVFVSIYERVGKEKNNRIVENNLLTKKQVNYNEGNYLLDVDGTIVDYANHILASAVKAICQA